MFLAFNKTQFFLTNVVQSFLYTVPIALDNFNNVHMSVQQEALNFHVQPPLFMPKTGIGNAMFTDEKEG